MVSVGVSGGVSGASGVVSGASGVVSGASCPAASGVARWFSTVSGVSVAGLSAFFFVLLMSL